MNIFAYGELARFLQIYGGWGMVVILCIAILLLYKSKEKRDQIYSDLLEKRNQQFIDVLKDAGSTLISIRDALAESSELSRKVQGSIEEVNRIILNCEHVRRMGGGK